jgi:hypothetical protein
MLLHAKSAVIQPFGTGVLHLIHINHQPDATISVYYPGVYLELNMFREFSRPSSGAQ